ncbi:Meckelin [Cladochytrium replicatum]|nr:Meckelin [Cladochytrium replicatum]
MSTVVQCETYWSTQACNALANLCILQLYDEASSPCIAYQRIATTRSSSSTDNPDTPKGMPWLYYGLLNREDPSVTARRILNVSLAIASIERGASHTFAFVLGTYTVNGTFLGYQNLTTQFGLCESSASVSLLSWLQFGTGFAIQCARNIVPLIRAGQSQTLFYEICKFLRLYGTLYPIPVRPLNFRSAGRLVNVQDRTSNTGAPGAASLVSSQSTGAFSFSNNRFVRRFMLYDTVTGVQNGVLRAVRVPVRIQIWITKNADESSGMQIFLPLVDVQYAERSVSDLSTTDGSIVSSPKFFFGVTYSMDLEDFWRVMTILFSFACVIGGCLGIYFSHHWSKRNNGINESYDLKFFVHLVFTIAGCMAPIFFVLLLGVCLYFFIFFKGQTVLFTTLPVGDWDIGNFQAVLITAFVAEATYVGMKVYNQCSIDVFFVDWEKSRGTLQGPTSEGVSRPAPVSVWRTIFMANQLNSIQCHRRINIEFTLIALYVILHGVRLRNAASPVPATTDRGWDLNSGAVGGTVHPILLFVVNSLTWLVLIIAQVSFRVILFDRFYRNRMLQYVDLLSVSNVSLIVLDERCHGYYIHGRSVHGYADTDMPEMHANFKKEENDLVPKRGLNDTDQQTFEVFLTKQFRTTYEKVYRLVVAENKFFISNVQLNGPQRRAPKAGTEKSLKAYQTINKFLLSFFDKNLKEYPYIVRQKTYLERFLGTTPEMNAGTVLVHDERILSSVVLAGIEFSHLVCLILLYNVVDIFAYPSYSTTTTTNNDGTPTYTFLPLLLTYLFDVMIRLCRKFFGERNIARKTLLDLRFLI